jgi:hypothetical protein
MAFTSSSTQLPEAFEQPSGNLLRPDQMSEHENDIKATRQQLENPLVQNKGDVRKRLASLEQQYEKQAPRPIADGNLKDKLAEEGKQLLDEILPGMLSQEEMRKNPAGSVDKHMRWERANKAKILRWKKIQLMLNADQSRPHTWDRDAANLERYRPEGPVGRFRADAQIPGKMSYFGVADENWREAFGEVAPPNSALNQAKKAHAANAKKE